MFSFVISEELRLQVRRLEINFWHLLLLVSFFFLSKLFLNIYIILFCCCFSLFLFISYFSTIVHFIQNHIFLFRHVTSIKANFTEVSNLGDAVLYAPYTGPSSCTLGRRVQHCTLHSMQHLYRDLTIISPNVISKQTLKSKTTLWISHLWQNIIVKHSRAFMKLSLVKL